MKQSLLIGPTNIPLQDTTYPKHILDIVSQFPTRECYVFRSGTTGQNTRHTYTEFLDILNRVIHSDVRDGKKTYSRRNNLFQRSLTLT